MFNSVKEASISKDITKIFLWINLSMNKTLKETDMTILITSQDMKIIITIEIDNNIATIDKENHLDLIHL